MTCHAIRDQLVDYLYGELPDEEREVFDLLWYRPGAVANQKAKAELPLNALFRGVQVAIFRSAWNDPKALYIGVKGGRNGADHSHLDLGSFVLDDLGYRWAVDLGGDDYNLPA